jgi:hypothetical protein
MTSLSWQSLRTRLVAGALCAAVASIWIVTLVIGKYLRADMEAAISAQQYSTVSLIASEIDRSVNSGTPSWASWPGAWAMPGGGWPRRQGLARIPVGAGADVQLGRDRAGCRWRGIASVPGKHNRVGGRLRGPELLRQAQGEQRAADHPAAAGPAHRCPVLTVAQAIRAPGGRFIGAVLGVTNLHEPNFLDQVGSAKYGRTGISWSPMPGRAPMSPRPTSAG